MSNNNSRKPNEVIVNQTSITSEDESPILSKLKELLEAADGTDNCFPGLVLSIIGDSESYVPKPWNTVAFTSGLLQSIQGVKKSWVIYRGKTGGISRLIYDAFRETSNTKSPTEPKNKNKETFNNNTLIAIRPAKKIEKKGKDKVTEPNWCISLKSDFEDDQKPHPRRYKWFNRYVCHFLEKLSAEYTPLLSKENEKVLIKMRVPVLVIAVEGDQYTIHQIKEAIQRNIPVLLMKGSGKAVDFIIEYLQESSQVERENILKVNAPLLLEENGENTGTQPSYYNF
ncbi:unnamed protein product [Mytilus edulis]|uniref:TRPM SLOG domain-containing protein n=1 Tax=Mytilus edulis TaxID=6550 RepID=A0A8S3RI45_MYTED|nr:unnamed protein product [Mytilus edulis]